MKKNIFGAAIVVSLMTVAAYAAFFIAPTERTMGPIQRIFYLHAPSGMVALLAFFICFVGNIAYVFQRQARWDWLGVSAAEVGMAFCTVLIITGPIWAHPVWGIWWTWDARLTLTFVLWLLYASYLLLRTLVEDPDRRALISAIYGIFAFLDVPLVYGSIRWWRTQHPQPVVFGGQGSGLEPTMKKVFWFWVFNLIVLMIFLIRERYALESLRNDVQILERETETA
ncbi:MAG TPA: cytochrome c biogenesis protein CcsA [Candidatus Acidoferrum sp.]|jgi:heme exporter protein C